MAVKERPLTRRGILSVVSSVYDPIGFLAPFTLPVKLMLQNLCKLSYSWDDNIPQHYQLQWVGWLEDLCKLRTFSVPRCIKPKDFGQLKCPTTSLLGCKRGWLWHSFVPEAAKCQGQGSSSLYSWKGTSCSSQESDNPEDGTDSCYACSAS